MDLLAQAHIQLHQIHHRVIIPALQALRLHLVQLAQLLHARVLAKMIVAQRAHQHAQDRVVVRVADAAKLVKVRVFQHVHYNA